MLHLLVPLAVLNVRGQRSVPPPQVGEDCGPPGFLGAPLPGGTRPLSKPRPPGFLQDVKYVMPQGGGPSMMIPGLKRRLKVML